MKTRHLLISLLLIISFSAGSVQAAGFYDGKTALLCSVYQLFECDHPNGCVAVTPAEVRGMSHFDVDFRNKAITRADMESGQTTAITNVQSDIDGKLVVQGVDKGEEGVRDGAGFSVSIMDPEGTMVMAIAGDGFGIMGLGACVPKP